MKLQFRVMLIAGLAVVSANGFAQSGTTGPLTWVLSGTTPNYTLTISGSDTMPNYASTSGSPWYSYRNIIASVVIDSGVTTIGKYAFDNCRALTSVSIPNSVTNIGDDAFCYCSALTSVNIPNSVTSIGYGAFCYCSALTSVSIGNSVTSIGDCAFWDCSSLTSVSIGNSVTTIGNGAFNGCSSLTSVSIGNSVTNIGTSAFGGCSGLDSVSIPNSVTNIGNYAFSGCSGLISVSIGNSVTSIGNSVTSIGDYAFWDCSSLTSVTSNAMIPPTAGVNAFYNVPTTIPVYIPCGTFGLYSIAAEWSNFTNFIVGTARTDTTFYEATLCSNESYTDDNFPMPITIAGVYYATQVGNAGCDSNICLTLNYYPKQDTVVFNDTIYYGGDYTLNGFNITNATTSDTYFNNDLNMNGCDSVTRLDLTVGNVGIVVATHALPLRVFPNPTNGKLYVSTKGRIQYAPTTTTIELFDVVGMNVGAYRIRPTEEETVIDISHLAAGLYFLKIDGKTVKIVKQ